MLDRPNVLVVLVDCLRSRSLLDERRGAVVEGSRELIRRGVCFSDCIATTTTTSPSIASLFTGVLPFVHGVRSLWGYKIDPTISTIAEVLASAGYYTRAETVGPVRAGTGFERGFHDFRHRRPEETLTTSTFRDEIRRTLDELPVERPWFLYLHLWELHWPRFVPPAFDARSFGVHRYERALSALDALVLPDVVARAGDDTVLLMTGDHGEIPRYDGVIGFGRRLRLKPITHFFGARAGHSFHVYEDQVRVPAVLAGPGVPAVGVRSTAVRHIDVLPTLLELVDVADPDAARRQGESLSPLFDAEGAARPGYSEAVSVNWSPDRWLVAVRHDGWKYVKRPADGRRWLWRLPDERTNLVRTHPDVADRLELLLSDLQSGTALDARGDDAREGMSDDEVDEVEEHLRELGYID